MRHHPTTRYIATTTAITAAVAALSTSLLGTSAQAHESCPPAPATCAQSVATSSASWSPYAVPLTALDGETLASYIADHRSRDPRLHALR